MELINALVSILQIFGWPTVLVLLAIIGFILVILVGIIRR